MFGCYVCSHQPRFVSQAALDEHNYHCHRQAQETPREEWDRELNEVREQTFEPAWRRWTREHSNAKEYSW